MLPEPARRDAAAVALAPVVAVPGAAALLLALTVLPWFRAGSRFFEAAGGQTFTGVRADLRRLEIGAATFKAFEHVGFGVSITYFTWLGWVLAGLCTLLVAASAIVRGRAGRLTRAAGALLSATAIALTLWALNLVTYHRPLAARIPGGPPHYGDYLRHTAFGPWVAITGFALLGLACALTRTPPAGQPPEPPDDPPALVST